MAIRARLETDLTWLHDSMAAMNEMPKMIEIAGGEAFHDIHDPFLADLQYQPGPIKEGTWRKTATKKQKQAYFASNGFEAGIPFKRTGKLAAAWIIKEVIVDGVWKVLVSNPSKAARYVYGSLALSNPKKAARFQQNFHAITGWNLAAPTVIYWYDKLQKQFIINMNILIGEIGTPAFRRRGFTPRLPKRQRRK
jgi:hypothetical protein